MNAYGQLINENTLQFERLLPGPIERVWEYLTDEKKRARWFAGGPMDAHSGGKVEYRFNHKNLSSHPDPIPEKYSTMKDGMTSVADVLTFEPPHLLIIHWEGGEITFQLKQEGDLVRLTLTHENLHKDLNERVGAMAGWHTHLDILVDRLNDREPNGFWAVHMVHEKEYEEKLS